MDAAEERKHSRQMRDEWENLRDLFSQECARINVSASTRAEVSESIEDPDNEDAFCIINARRDRNKPLLQFELHRDVPSIVCIDHWNTRPKQSFKFVFYGDSVMLTGGTGTVAPTDIVRGRMMAIMPGLKT